jgi:hypothetical protein
VRAQRWAGQRQTESVGNGDPGALGLFVRRRDSGARLKWRDRPPNRRWASHPRQACTPLPGPKWHAGAGGEACGAGWVL